MEARFKVKLREILIPKDLEDLENFFFFLILKRCMERYSEITRKEDVRSGWIQQTSQ